jgi:hypothetical protein
LRETDDRASQHSRDPWQDQRHAEDRKESNRDITADLVSVNRPSATDCGERGQTAKVTSIPAGIEIALLIAGRSAREKTNGKTGWAHRLAIILVFFLSKPGKIGCHWTLRSSHSNSKTRNRLHPIDRPRVNP